jgi:hypothetical protein
MFVLVLLLTLLDIIVAFVVTNGEEESCQLITQYDTALPNLKFSDGWRVDIQRRKTIVFKATR